MFTNDPLPEFIEMYIKAIDTIFNMNLDLDEIYIKYKINQLLLNKYNKLYNKQYPLNSYRLRVIKDYSKL